VKVWLLIGLGGQVCFLMRFVVQWIASERHGASIIPIYFWYLSLAGGLTLLVYALHVRDPVFIIGQSTGVFIYIRNLMLIRKKDRGRRETLDDHDTQRVRNRGQMGGGFGSGGTRSAEI